MSEAKENDFSVEQRRGSGPTSGGGLRCLSKKHSRDYGLGLHVATHRRQTQNTRSKTKINRIIRINPSPPLG